MADAFIYDAVRTPRGRGKADGSLHEVTALNLAAQTLAAIKDRNKLDTALRRRRRTWVRRSGRRGGRRHCTRGGACRRLRREVPGVQINRFCASGLDAVNFAAAEVMSGQHEMTIGGGVESMSRVGIGASGGAWPIDPSIARHDLFCAAGHLRRPDRDQIWLLARRRRRLCGRKPEARGESLGRRPLQELGRAGKRRQRPHDSRPRRAYAPEHDHAVACRAEAVLRADGRDGGFDAVAVQRYPEVEAVNHVHHAGNSSGIVDGAAAVLIGSKAAGKAAGLKPRARIRAFANIGSEPAIMLTGPIDVTEKVLKKAGMTHERHRPVRAQRSLRLGGAALHAGARHSDTTRSTSMAAPSRWAIRSARPAR